MSDDHVLAGRSAARGGPTLTATERAQGFFVSSDAALANLQTDLRTRLDLRLSLKGAVEAMLNGRVTKRDPRAPRPSLSTSGSTLASPVVPGLSLPDILRNDPANPGELQTLCAHPLLGPGIGSCGSNPFSGLDDIPFDDLHVDLEAENITVAWDAPTQVARMVPTSNETGACTTNPAGALVGSCKQGFECPRDASGTVTAGTCVLHPCTTNADCVDPACAPWGGCTVDGSTTGTCDTTAGRCTRFIEQFGNESDLSPTAPTLRVTVPFHLDLDPNDFIGSFIDIDLQQLVVEFRLQPRACSDGSCRMFGREVFDNYTAPGRDVTFSLAGVDVRAISKLASRSYETFPLPPCFLPFTEALLQPFFPAPPGVSAFACVYIATDVIPPLLNKALDGAARGMGNLLNPLLSPPAIVIPTAGFPTWLTLDASRTFFTTNATAGSASRTLNLAAASGAWTNNTVDILARGAQFDSVRVDLSTSPLPAACASPVGAALLGPQCTALCGGTAPTCAMTNAKVCFRMNGETAPCTGGLSLTGPELTSLLLLVRGIPGSGFTLTNAQIAALVARIAGATAPIPAVPNLATLFDAAPAIASTVQSVFTKPLEAAFGDGAFYSDIIDCPEFTGRPATCPVGAVGPTFIFTVDTDRDGLPDDVDLCPTDPDTGNINTDGDAFCDTSDLCPFTPSDTNSRRYCSCDYDGDGCNNELLGTPIASAPASVPRSCDPGPAGVYDARPGSSDRGSDEPDRDGISDDCDPDDDNDTVPDTADNCPTVPNTDQADYNSDGVGDVCDALCWGPGAPCPSAEDPAAFGPIDLIDFDHGMGLIPGCLADGPGCWGFFRFDCVGVNGSCFEDFFIDRVEGGLPGYFATLPELSNALPFADLDGDGFAELLVASQSTGLRALSGRTGEALWQTKLAVPSFGSSLALSGGLIAVGAPDHGLKAASREGAVFWFDAKGTQLGKAMFGKLAGGRFGATLSEAHGVVFAGAPGSQLGDYGKLYALLGSNTLPTEALDGKSVQVPVGAQSPVAMKIQGIETLIVPSANAGTGGAVLVIEQKGGSLGKLLMAFKGDAKSRFGTSLSAPADFNGDGVLEVAVGAPGYGQDSGTVLLLSSDAKLTNTGLWGPPGSRFGESVSALGDLTGDGASELGVTLPGHTLAGSKMSGSYVVFGRGKK